LSAGDEGKKEGEAPAKELSPEELEKAWDEWYDVRSKWGVDDW
jgi:hypothetical protein